MFWVIDLADSFVFHLKFIEHLLWEYFVCYYSIIKPIEYLLLEAKYAEHYCFHLGLSDFELAKHSRWPDSPCPNLWFSCWGLLFCNPILPILPIDPRYPPRFPVVYQLHHLRDFQSIQISCQTCSDDLKKARPHHLSQYLMVAHDFVACCW